MHRLAPLAQDKHPRRMQERSLTPEGVSYRRLIHIGRLILLSSSDKLVNDNWTPLRLFFISVHSKNVLILKGYFRTVAFCVSTCEGGIKRNHHEGQGNTARKSPGNQRWETVFCLRARRDVQEGEAD